MSPESQNIDHYVEHPDALVELCREVLKRLEKSDSKRGKREEETQLKEISKTIQRLEKSGVSVPDALRQEKTRLVTDLALEDEEEDAHRRFVAGLDALIDGSVHRSKPVKGKMNGPGRRTKRGPQTAKKELREQIVKALRKLGGSGHVNDVLEAIGQEMDGRLMPGDLDWLKKKNLYQWQYMCHWQAYHLRKDGTLKESTRKGYWELNQ